MHFLHMPVSFEHASTLSPRRTTTPSKHNIQDSRMKVLEVDLKEKRKINLKKTIAKKTTSAHPARKKHKKGGGEKTDITWKGRRGKPKQSKRNNKILHLEKSHLNDCARKGNCSIFISIYKKSQNLSTPTLDFSWYLCISLAMSLSIPRTQRISQSL